MPPCYKDNMTTYIAELNKAAHYIKDQCPDLIRLNPKVAIILGSGLTPCLNQLMGALTKAIAYKDIPFFGQSTVEGHKGELIFTMINDKIPALIMSGRLHLYEGHKATHVITPLRVMHLLGCQTAIITNASGAIGDGFESGHFMVISDQINLTGYSPLVGKNIDELGPRFVDMTEAYDKNLITLTKQMAKDVDAVMHEGVYAGVLGPSYETPAEVRMLKTLGAHAVGMSTVYEVIAARHMKMRVLGIACLTNKAAGLIKKTISHQEVMENNSKLSHKLGLMLCKLMQQLPMND
jgi:purine-nucleoside phosphorylase